MKTFESDLGGPFDLIFGLPLHPLVVHSAVVLIPLVALAAIIMAVRPSFTVKFGKAVFLLAVVAQGAMFIAKSSGESFEERLGKEVERHAELGEIAPFTSLPLLALIFLKWRINSGLKVSRTVDRLISIALVVAALVALVYIYLTGHSGADSVWGWISEN
jgi:uncharacterized membrane protein